MKRPSLAETLLAASSLPLLSSAWPLLNLRDIHLSPRNPLPATYSVVAVDGGSTTTAAATETVTQPISITTTLLSTIVSTIVVTEAETPTTILITLTLSQPPTTTVVVTPDVMTTVEPQPQPSAVTTEVLATVTVTAPSTMTSETYDNGMWHTTYYHAVPAAPTVASVPSTELVESFPTETPEAAPSTTPSTISFPNFMNGTIWELPRVRRS